MSCCRVMGNNQMSCSWSWRNTEYPCRWQWHFQCNYGHIKWCCLCYYLFSMLNWSSIIKWIHCDKLYWHLFVSQLCYDLILLYFAQFLFHSLTNLFSLRHCLHSLLRLLCFEWHLMVLSLYHCFIHSPLNSRRNSKLSCSPKYWYWCYCCLLQFSCDGWGDAAGGGG